MASHILLVEDTADLRDNISEALSMEGYSVRSSGNGKQAIEQMMVNRPALIITDLLMPEMDGFELIKHIRGVHNWDDIAILVYSAMPPQETEKKVLTLGANLYLKKPSTLEALVDAVQKLTDYGHAR
jgi:DNA-binding response OmpR family regulator